MDLNKVNIAIRPREAYEGLDLGFAMASKWFISLWALWIVTALPVVILTHGLCFKYPGIALFIIWWLKPVFETPILYWLSRIIFNTRPDMKTMYTSIFSIIRPQLFSRLTVRRLSPSRSFYMPVILLENLKGKDYSQRTAVLGHNQNAGFTLTWICSLFECVLFMSAIFLFMVLIPDELASFKNFAFFSDHSFFAILARNIILILCMSLIAPFYIASGFALYLTQRTRLEAWDIELNFKRLVARKKDKGLGITAMIIACGFFLAMVIPLSSAQASGITKHDSKKLIEEVLKNEDFGQKKTVSSWKLKSLTKPQKTKPLDFGDIFEALARFFTIILKPILWAAGGIMFACFLYFTAKHMDLIHKKDREKPFKPPEDLFGLKLTKESLPSDITGEVRVRLAENDLRGALSLLYRGTLYFLIFKDLIEIPGSATEGECVARVEKKGEKDKTIFFRDLTNAWLNMAYGHIRPERQKIESLCLTWDHYYSKASQ